MDEIKLKIDGKGVTGRLGQTIMEVAGDNGIDIPHLCYHPKLSKTGACRLCIVRINGKMLTPRRESGLLAGVMRQELLECGEIVEAMLFPEDLLKAEELWLINSVRGMRRAVLVEGEAC